MPPTAVISLIISTVIQSFIKNAILVMVPWYINTGMVENKTPIPKEAESIMDDMPSRADFAIKILGLPLIPSSIAPITAIEPTQ